MRAKKKTAGKRSKGANRYLEHEVEGGVAGAIAGAAFGMIAGPPGVLAGAVVGGAAGGLAAAVLDREDSKRTAHTRELDAAIGVSGGDLGAPGLEHPPATVGAYSGASSGVGSVSGESDELAEGPMQAPDT